MLTPRPRLHHLTAIVPLQVATLALMTIAQPAAAVQCTVFTPGDCWFEFPKQASEKPRLLPPCGEAPCEFEESALECPFFSSGAYATAEDEDCEPFMWVRVAVPPGWASHGGAGWNRGTHQSCD